MQTIASIQCEEFYQLRDFVDILENFLPEDDSCPEEVGKVTICRDKLALMGERELDGGIEPYDSIMALADDMFRCSVNWMFDKPGALEKVAGYEALDIARLNMMDMWGERLSDYSVTRYLDALESLEEDTPSLRIKICSEAFSHYYIEGAGHIEGLASMRHQVADLTGDQTPRPGPLEAFDADKVRIQRHWLSSTELTTSVYYDGVKLGDFQGNAILHPLGHYAPEMSETKAVRAARKLFYSGHQGTGLVPLVTSTASSMCRQLQQDLVTAKSLLNDSQGKMADLARIEGAIQNQYAHLATPQPHSVLVRGSNSPGM